VARILHYAVIGLGAKPEYITAGKCQPGYRPPEPILRRTALRLETGAYDGGSHGSLMCD